MFSENELNDNQHYNDEADEVDDITHEVSLAFSVCVVGGPTPGLHDRFPNGVQNNTIRPMVDTLI